jgi:hypothetical protein
MIQIHQINLKKKKKKGKKKKWLIHTNEKSFILSCSNIKSLQTFFLLTFKTVSSAQTHWHSFKDFIV